MSTDRTGLVEEIAEAVADGERVDWPEARRRSRGSAAAGAVRNLELIDTIGGTGRSSTATAVPDPGVQPLLLVLIPLVALQVAAAAVGLVLGAGGRFDVPGWLLLFSALVFGAAGAAVAVAGRWDRRTAPLAGLFLAIASATSLPSLGHAVRDAPFPPGRWLAAFPLETFFPFFLWWFVSNFPRVVRVERRQRWIRTAITVSAALGIVLFALNAADRLMLDGGAIRRAAPFLLRSPTGGYWLLLLGLALPAPFVVFLRLRHTTGDERRRAALFVTGLAVGIVPMLVAVLAEIVSPGWRAVMEIPRNRMIGSFVVYGFMLTIPVTLGYAAVARRVLDIRFMLDRAARAALAKGTLWTVSIAPWAALSVLLWLGRDQSLDTLFRNPALPSLVALGLAGIALVLGRERLLTRLEVALSGAPRDQSAALAELSRRLSEVRDTDELSLLVGGRAAAMLDAMSCRLLVRSLPDDAFHTPDPGCRPLAPESALVELARSSPTAIATDPRDPDSWLPWLPEADRLWIADGDVRLLLPVADRDGETSALIAFGPTVSGRPYSRVQRDTASAIASAVSLALARSDLRADAGRSPDRAADRAAGECPNCRRVAASPDGPCSCGHDLQPAAIPHRLAGKFRLDRVLGHGGMGVVYLATDLTLDRRVALKTLPRMSSESLLRLRREARSMASFVHPNLALIFGAETWRGIPVLVVEYLAGGTLTERLNRSNDPAFVAELGVKLAGALAALHGKGLLHRDVKPANIGFSEAVEPKLLDFGLSRIVEEARIDFGSEVDLAFEPSDRGGRLTRTGNVVGTPLYLSPEILHGARPSPSQDLWALHVVLWEALAGRHPLAGLGRDAALARIRDGRMPSPASARPDCPAVLVSLLERGLDPRPAARPQSAAELRRDLESARATIG